MIDEVDLGTGDVEVPDFRRRIRAEAKINELVREVNRLTRLIEAYNQHRHALPDDDLNPTYTSKPKEDKQL